jgi:uncharacterized protein (TIGR00369 family)
MARMTADEIARFVADHFPQARGFSQIEHVSAEMVRVRLPFRDDYLRPGGTLSGPTLMALADTATWFLVLANVGPVALTLTTNLNINFLRRPQPRDLIAEARLLKLGRRIAVGDVRMMSDGDDAPVAQATVTYSIPADRP